MDLALPLVKMPPTVTTGSMLVAAAAVLEAVVRAVVVGTGVPVKARPRDAPQRPLWCPRRRSPVFLSG